MRSSFVRVVSLLLPALGGGATSGCFTWSGVYDEGSALVHPSMTPDDLSGAMDRKVRAHAEGSAPAEASLAGR